MAEDDIELRAFMREATKYFERLNNPLVEVGTQPDPWVQEHRGLLRESLILSRMNSDTNARAARALEHIGEQLSRIADHVCGATKTQFGSVVIKGPVGVIWNILEKLIGFVPAVVKVVRETSRKRRVAGTGHYYTAVEWYPDGRVSVRAPTCFYCGHHDLNRTIHTEPACLGRREP